MAKNLLDRLREELQPDQTGTPQVLFHGTSWENAKNIDKQATLQPFSARVWHNEGIGGSERPLVFASEDPKIALIHALGKTGKEKAFLGTRSGNYMIFSHDIDMTDPDKKMGVIYSLAPDSFRRTRYPDVNPDGSVKQTDNNKPYARPREHNPEWVSESPVFSHERNPEIVRIKDAQLLINEGVIIFQETHLHAGRRATDIADLLINNQDSQKEITDKLIEKGMVTQWALDQGKLSPLSKNTDMENASQESPKVKPSLFKAMSMDLDQLPSGTQKTDHNPPRKR